MLLFPHLFCLFKITPKYKINERLKMERHELILSHKNKWGLKID